MDDALVLRYEKLRIRAKELGTSVIPKTLTDFLNDAGEEYLERLSAKIEKIEKQQNEQEPTPR